MLLFLLYLLLLLCLLTNLLQGVIMKICQLQYWIFAFCYFWAAVTKSLISITEFHTPSFHVKFGSTNKKNVLELWTLHEAHILNQNFYSFWGLCQMPIDVVAEMCIVITVQAMGGWVGRWACMQTKFVQTPIEISGNDDMFITQSEEIWNSNLWLSVYAWNK